MAKKDEKPKDTRVEVPIRPEAVATLLVRLTEVESRITQLELRLSKYGL